MAYSRLGYPHSLSAFRRGFVSAPLNSGVPVLDQDINLMQGIELEHMETLFRIMFTAGWTVINESDSLSDFTDFGINNFRIVQPNHFVFDGLGITFAESFTDTNVITTSSTTDPTDPVYDGDELPLSVPSTHTDDLFFLEFWREEIDDLGTIYRYGNTDHYDPSYYSNDIIDPAVGDPAAVRLQLRYRLRQVAGANHMRDLNVYIQGKKDTPDKVRRWNYDAYNNIYYHDTTESTVIGEFDDFNGIVYATPLCWTYRVVSDDDFADAVFTDYRQRLTTRIHQFGTSGEADNPASPSLPGDPGEVEGEAGTSCQNVEVIGQIYSLEKVDVVDSANAVTVYFCQGNVHFIDLVDATADVDLTLDGGQPGGVYYICFKQHPTDPVQITYPGDVSWVVGSEFELSEEPEAVNIIQFIRTSNPAYRAIGYGENGLQFPPCQHDLTVVGDAEVDFNECKQWRLFLTSADSPFDLTLTNGETGGFYILELVQGPTPVTVNWDANIVWVEGDTFVLNTDASGVDIVFLYFDGTYYYSIGHGEKGKSYLELSDTTDTTFFGKATWVPQVNGGATALTLVSPATLASSIYLTDLADVVTSTVAGEILYYDGATWRNIVGATWSESYLALNNLSNVTVPSPSSGHVLQYNGSAWVNVSAATLAASINLNDLGDVVITTPAAWNLLIYSGGSWINTTPATIIANNVALDDLSNVYGTTGTPTADNIVRADSGGGYTIATVQAMCDAYVPLYSLSNVASLGGEDASHILRYSGGSWFNAGIAAMTEAYVALNNLSNVSSIGGEDDSHILRYNGTWYNTGIAAMCNSYVTLTNLSNVSLGGEADDHILRYFSGNWGNVGITAMTESYVALNNLSNVNASPSANDVLYWNGSSWAAIAVGSLVGAVSLGLDDLTDVVISGAALGDIILYNGGNWYNTNLEVIGARVYASHAAADSPYELTTGAGYVTFVTCNCYVPANYYAYVWGKYTTRDHANQFYYSYANLNGPAGAIDNAGGGNNDDDANTYDTVSLMGRWFNSGGSGTYAFSLQISAQVRGFEVTYAKVTAVAVSP